MSLNFPDSPTNGQEYEGYVYDSTANVWNRLPNNPEFVRFSESAPSNPQEGTLWFDTTVSKMYVYYNDGTSSQWVSAVGGVASQEGTSGQFLIHDGTDWTASDFTSTGSVLQTVSTTKTDTFTTSSTSFVDVTGVSASITPSSASSKIIVLCNFAGGSGPAGFGHFRIVRDGSAVNVGDSAGSRTQASNTIYGRIDEGETGYFAALSMSVNFLDSPSSTSSLTYTLQAAGAGGGTVAVGRSYTDSDNIAYSRTPSNIVLMEIAG